MVSSATVGAKAARDVHRPPEGGGCSPWWRALRCDAAEPPAAVDTGLGSVQMPGSESSGQVPFHILAYRVASPASKVKGGGETSSPCQLDLPGGGVDVRGRR
ncbi:hypothetical protein GWK47_017097 [Chionoecetes opilio]|uniref:Uncharacterized protein n=1 Tax=Chionoecetes opilio TaxID=41210 RepID=A0A8J4Y0H1_CHIOP|nr:hypothetical protein GWK47_017097 [Chionoecetes opilio]